MFKTNSITSDVSVIEKKLTVSDVELATYLSVGLSSARKIGEEAHAVLICGRLKRYNLKKIKDYIEKESH